MAVQSGEATTCNSDGDGARGGGAVRLGQGQLRQVVITAGDTLYNSAKTFEEFNLSQDLVKSLYTEMNFENPSKILGISLPMILKPPLKTLIAQAHNGSGKTTCFVLGMLSHVDPKLIVPQETCICSTRELTIQNMEVLKKMGKYT